MPVEHSPNQSRDWRSSEGKPPFPSCKLSHAASCLLRLAPAPASCFVTVH